MGKLPSFSDSNLIVGFDTGDDASVYKIDDNVAVVQTVDFFPPMLEDPYVYGQVAVANSLSDIYAMGTHPKVAMNILCVPDTFDECIILEILRGGDSKIREAGAVLAGGHTIVDENTKYGLCATGFIHPDKVMKNSSAKVGDILILTKPMGIGILNTANQGGLLTEEQYNLLVETMTTLNKKSAEVMINIGANACTDITGFGLLGHSMEVAEGSGVTIELFLEHMHLLPGVLEFAQMGMLSKATHQNRKQLLGKVFVPEGYPTELVDIACDPQTSGGLLISVPADRSRKMLEELLKVSPHSCVIGQVVEKKDFAVEVV